jgi:hypothetical protein
LRLAVHQAEQNPQSGIAERLLHCARASLAASQGPRP